jgi:hypothetical protein
LHVTATAESATPCDCESPGYFNSGIPGILAHIEDDGLLAHDAVIERCDLCARYPDDAAAAELLKHRKRAPPQPRCTATYEFDITYLLPRGKSNDAVAAEFGRVLDELVDDALGSGFGGELSNCDDLSRGSFKLTRTTVDTPLAQYGAPVFATLYFTDDCSQQSSMLLHIEAIHRVLPGHATLLADTVCGRREVIGRLLEQKSAVRYANRPPHIRLRLPSRDGNVTPLLDITLQQFLITSYATTAASGDMSVASRLQIYISVDDANLIAERLYESFSSSTKESIDAQANEKAENDRPAAQT